MTRKYQVWFDDSKLIGHILCDDNDIVTIDDAVDYAQRVWADDVTDDMVSVCEIPMSYYQDMYRSSAKDSIALGM